MVNKFVFWVSIISLFSTITNIIPLSALILITLPLLPLYISEERYLNKIFVFTFLMFVYFIFSAVIYYPGSFIEYEFFRRDGNIFITFSPLLLLTIIKLKINIIQIYKRFIYWATAVNFIFFSIYLFTGGTIFFYEDNVYHFLFEAHNAAGGFLMMLTAFSMGYYFTTYDKKFLLITIINSLTLYASYSRGSMLGLLFACLVVFIFKGNMQKKFIYTVILLQLILYIWLYLNAPPDFLTNNLFTVDVIDVNEGGIDRGGTIINRMFYLWPRAIHLFLSSPIFGTGFGSYNDLPYNLYGLNTVIQLNIPKNVEFSSSHAHNSYLHFLAETGIVGFNLLLFLLRELFRNIEQIPIKSLKYSLLVAFWSAIGSSFTEHRICTPSQMLPFIILFGLTFASLKNNKNLGENVNKGFKLQQNL